ncbi:MAG TPA: zinc-ribbon domain-containing protein [Cyclobacteriaceae bacterium]|nr:zinc-ribbon domain-containing protein [Cyclobacteriaceae bacterium]
MIILFGSRTGHVKTLKVPGNCKNCATSESVELIVYQRFAHIFWIPVFPIRKIYTTQCYKCKASLVESEIKDSYLSIYQQARKSVSTPFWSFTGPILFGSLVLLITVLGYFKEIKKEFMIHDPQSGDVYKYKLESGEYSLLKVSEVTGDTVYVFMNSYSTYRPTGITKLMNQGRINYSKEAVPKLRSDLIRMFENGEILDIERE